MITADVTIQCPECTVNFAIPAESWKKRKEQKKTVTCPICNCRIIWNQYQTDLENAQERVKYLEGRKDSLLSEISCAEFRIRSLRGTVTRLQRQLAEARGKAAK